MLLTNIPPQSTWVTTFPFTHSQLIASKKGSDILNTNDDGNRPYYVRIGKEANQLLDDINVIAGKAGWSFRIPTAEEWDQVFGPVCHTNSYEIKTWETREFVNDGIKLDIMMVQHAKTNAIPHLPGRRLATLQDRMDGKKFDDCNLVPTMEIGEEKDIRSLLDTKYNELNYHGVKAAEHELVIYVKYDYNYYEKTTNVVAREMGGRSRMSLNEKSANDHVALHLFASRTPQTSATSGK